MLQYLVANCAKLIKTKTLSTTKLLKSISSLKYHRMLEGNTGIAEPHLEV